MDNNYIILSDALPFEESGYNAQTSQKLVKLLPLGLVHSTKGDFLVDDESFRLIRCKGSQISGSEIKLSWTRLLEMRRTATAL